MCAVTVYGVRSGERESPSAMGYSLETRIVHKLWIVSRFNVQTAPEGDSEQWISRHGVG